MLPEVAYPPHRIHTSRTVSTIAAYDLLSAYLVATETSPHLHPDGLLSTAGAQFATSAGPMGGVVLHNLRRVEAGLRGEHLEPDLEVLEEDDVVTGAEFESNEGVLENQLNGVGNKRTAQQAEEGWQDIEEYQREQGPVVGEVGTRSNFVADGVAEPIVVAHREGVKESKVDKAARKKAKKERDEKKKREKEMLRQKKAKMGD